jgi:hypothetical protein
MNKNFDMALCAHYMAFTLETNANAEKKSVLKNK